MLTAERAPRAMLPMPQLQRRRTPIGYLPSLDGWRCIAILFVLGAHSADNLTALFPAIAPFARFMGTNGEFGVHIFFGLSGFLITCRLLEEHAARGTISLKGFYLRRSFRILPAMLLFLASVASLHLAGLLPLRPGSWISALGFYANYDPGPHSWYVGHFWSLAVEEHFYLLWPTLLVLFGLSRGLGLSVAAALAVIFWRVIHFKLGWINAISGVHIGRTDMQADGLLWGCACAFLFADPRRHATLQKLLNLPLWTLTIALLAACILYQPHWWLTWQALLAFQKLLIALAVLGTVLRPAALPARLLEWMPLRWTGRLSYSIYLWQQCFFVPDSHRVHALGWLQSFPFNLPILLAIAAGSYYFIERPLMKIGHRLATPVTSGRPDVVLKTPSPADFPLALASSPA